jgi:hypothetical protein
MTHFCKTLEKNREIGGNQWKYQIFLGFSSKIFSKGKFEGKIG